MPGLVDDVVLPPPPPKVVGSATKRATRPSNKLPQSLIDSAKVDKKETFDAKKHLNFSPPKRIIKMSEIGLDGQGISPHAVIEPFTLFTEEAIQQMRAEIFSKECMEHCQYTSTFNRNMVRGMGHARAPFTYDAWHSPEVLAKLSQVAGIDLVPSFDFEIANINISISTQEKPLPGERPADDADLPAVAWHYDSFPFVCVTMLSDCEGMVGGETAVRTPSGDVLKVRGPSKGTAVMLQGRYIEHQALKAFGGRERITMVTCFRPRDPTVKDETVLTGVRGISPLGEMYEQYTDYRLDILEQRIHLRREQERRRQIARRPFDIKDTRRYLAEQKAFIESMLEEIYDVED